MNVLLYFFVVFVFLSFLSAGERFLVSKDGSEVINITPQTNPADIGGTASS